MRKSLLSVAFVLMTIVLAVAVALPVYGAPQAQDPVTVKMGLLPILDVLPFYVAAEAGYFEAEGLNVELVPVGSAAERDQLIIAGEIDGMLNDLISTGIFNQDQSFITIVAQARRAYEDSPQFRILAAPRSNITIPSDLTNVEIGISENSVIHYIAQRILEDAGVSAEDLSFRAEPNIPVRFQLLMEGSLLAACLPDPLAQAAIEGGAILIADDTSLVDTEFSQSVLSFRTTYAQDNPAAVEAFLRAWMQAADDINADPDAYRDLWLENTTVPDSVKDTYVLPPFPTYAITDESAWNDTIEWLLAEDIVDNGASYEDSVNPSFIEAIAPAEAMSAGDVANGQMVFNANGCIGCHAVDSADPGVGPGLLGLVDHAGTAVEGLDAAAYVRQSIVEPGAYVAEGYNNIMPAFDALSDSDLNDLVAYLLSLK